MDSSLYLGNRALSLAFPFFNAHPANEYLGEQGHGANQTGWPGVLVSGPPQAYFVLVSQPSSTWLLFWGRSGTHFRGFNV